MKQIHLPESTVFAIRTVYDISKAIWVGLFAYLITISGHYIFGFGAKILHDIGVVAALICFLIVFIHFGIKNKWFEKIEKRVEDEKETSE